MVTPPVQPGRPATALPVQRAAPKPAERAVARLRGAADTAPGRLRLASVVLAVLVLAFGALTAWQVSSRATAAGQVFSHSEPLSQDAAEIYRSLADADTTAAGGFLLAGDAPQAVRDRYQNDLTTAGRLLTEAAARTGPSSGAQRWVTQLNQDLPQYAGLVETARANDRQGLPLGGAYLRYASNTMQDTMLPAAQQLVDVESRQLDADYADARSFPWAAAGLGVVTLAGLIRCQLLLRRRTNRVFNLGLLGATASVLAALVWLTSGTVSGSADLSASRSHGALPLRALDQARTEALQSRAAENLDLVARGATDSYTKRWATVTALLAGPPTVDGKSRTKGGMLDQARAGAPGEAGADLTQAKAQFAVWDTWHRTAAASNDAGDYNTALTDTIGSTGSNGTGTNSSDSAFNAMDQQLAKAAVVEQAAFRSAAQGVDGSLGILAAGAALLAALATAGVLVGLGRRLAEYR